MKPDPKNTPDKIAYTFVQFPFGPRNAPAGNGRGSSFTRPRRSGTRPATPRSTSGWWPAGWRGPGEGGAAAGFHWTFAARRAKLAGSVPTTARNWPPAPWRPQSFRDLRPRHWAARAASPQNRRVALPAGVPQRPAAGRPASAAAARRWLRGRAAPAAAGRDARAELNALVGAANGRAFPVLRKCNRGGAEAQRQPRRNPLKSQGFLLCGCLRVSALRGCVQRTEGSANGRPLAASHSSLLPGCEAASVQCSIVSSCEEQVLEFRHASAVPSRSYSSLMIEPMYYLQPPGRAGERRVGGDLAGEVDQVVHPAPAGRDSCRLTDRLSRLAGRRGHGGRQRSSSGRRARARRFERLSPPMRVSVLCRD